MSCQGALKSVAQAMDGSPENVGFSISSPRQQRDLAHASPEGRGALDMFPFWEHNDQVRVIAQRTLRALWEKHPKAEQPLRSWLQEMKRGSFRRPSDVRRHYRSADFVADDRVIFNIGGNKYRLIAHMSYRRQIAFIKFIGTHKQYDRIDAATVGRVK